MFARIYRDGTIPSVVVGLRGIVDGNTLVGLGPSGHAYVRDCAVTENHLHEVGLFTCVGLMLTGSSGSGPAR